MSVYITKIIKFFFSNYIDDIFKWSIKPSLTEKMVDILEFVADKDEFTTEEIIGQGIIAQCLLNGLGPHVKSSFTVLAGLFAETDPLTVKYL